MSAQGTPQQFALDVAKFAKLAMDRADLVVRKVVLDLGTRVVMRSPVGNPSLWKHPAPKGYVGGHFRANWQYGLDSAPGNTLPGTDKTGSKAVARFREGPPQKSYGHVHYIVNNLPYASRLETGWSKQAPAGMVGVTCREFQALMAKALGDAKRGG